MFYFSPWPDASITFVHLEMCTVWLGLSSNSETQGTMFPSSPPSSSLGCSLTTANHLPSPHPLPCLLIYYNNHLYVLLHHIHKSPLRSSSPPLSWLQHPLSSIFIYITSNSTFCLLDRDTVSMYHIIVSYHIIS